MMEKVVRNISHNASVSPRSDLKMKIYVVVSTVFIKISALKGNISIVHEKTFDKESKKNVRVSEIFIFFSLATQEYTIVSLIIFAAVFVDKEEPETTLRQFWQLSNYKYGKYFIVDRYFKYLLTRPPPFLLEKSKCTMIRFPGSKSKFYTFSEE
ncbi:hypothetical protein HNP38_003622 [Chryseobacterium defluvii]|uniref:Uncharacterized protein n=1 Tax=Chryseobacterium defluvii TaxID=160396 RepID=A0A840KLB0_9FLAO|nr:hypothetical protein [Chryseobacterium defluvii]MBB4808280.1 hypothetical protein [Chryseobacterium defluvii]